MNCSEFRKQMNNFINNTMEESDIEAFIEHYKECSKCNEELEIYYMVNKTFNDKAPSDTTFSVPNSFDFKKRLNQKISHYEEIIYHNYKIDFMMRLLIGCTELISVGMAVYFIINYLGGTNV